MFVFMGTYSPGSSNSGSDNDNQGDESAEDTDNRRLDDFSTDDVGVDEDVSEDETIGSDGSAGGNAGASVVVTGQPSSRDPEEDREEDVEEDVDQEEGEDEEQDGTVVIVQEVDPLNAMSWGVQPVMKRVEERYQDQVEIYYRSASVREFKNPAELKQQWIDSAEKHEMPVTPSFWDENPPESTELVNKACEAAAEQGRGEDYLRTLWINGVAGGQSISDRSRLVGLASDTGLDVEQFEEDLQQVELEGGSERDTLPFTFMEINGNQIIRGGCIYYSELKTQFIRGGLEEKDLRDLSDFVADHGPVATTEVVAVYEFEDCGEAVQKLDGLDQVSFFEKGGERFWLTKEQA